MGKVRSMFSEAEGEKVGKERKWEERRQVDGRRDSLREDDIVEWKIR